MSNPELIASLERVVVRLVQAPDRDTAISAALTFLIEATGADMGAVFAPAGTSLRFSFGQGLPKKFLRKPPLLERSAWDGAMIVQHSTGPAVDPALEQHARLAGVPTWASMPITYRDGFFGLVVVASRDLVGFSEQAVELFSIVSRVLGMALYGLGHAPPNPNPNPSPNPSPNPPPDNTSTG